MLVLVLKCPSQHTSKCVKCTSGARVGIHALSLFSSYIVRALARSLGRWLDRSPNHSIVWPLTTTLARSLVRSFDRNDFGNGISNCKSVPIILARFQFRIETARQIYFACVRTANYCSAGVRPSIFISFNESTRGLTHWLASWLAGFGWLAKLADWLADCLAGWSAGWMVHWVGGKLALSGRKADWLCDSPSGWQHNCLASCLTGWSPE